jgi:hypothetical protein
MANRSMTTRSIMREDCDHVTQIIFHWTIDQSNEIRVVKVGQDTGVHLSIFQLKILLKIRAIFTRPLSNRIGIIHVSSTRRTHTI